MGSIVFEGNTWSVYEDLRKKDKILHRNLCLILKEMQRANPDDTSIYVFAIGGHYSPTSTASITKKKRSR
jgi:hypothetical protein